MDDIRLVSISGENIRKLKTVAVKLDGEPGVFGVTSGGENDEGKTTFLNMIAMLFGGKKAVKVNTIQRGMDGAWIRGELNNGYSIDLRFTAKAPDGYLTITTPDGNTQKAPQSLLDSWCGPFSWDPGALLKRKTKEIEGMILDLASDPGLKGKRAEIGKQRALLLEERRPLNSQTQKASRTKRPEGTRPDPVDVSGEMERLTEMERQRDVRDTALRRADAVLEQMRASEQFASDERDMIEGLKKEYEEELRSREGDLLKHKERAKEQQSEAVRLNEEACALPYDEEGVEATRAHISDADTINESLEPWKEYDRAQSAGKEYSEQAEALTTQIKALDAEEEAMLKAAEIPVQGISFGEESEMLLHGEPLEVASGAQRLNMTCDMAFAANPQVRICLLDEANDFSLKSLEALRKRAAEERFQVIPCRLGVEGPGEIVIEDGTAKGGTP